MSASLPVPSQSTVTVRRQDSHYKQCNVYKLINVGEAQCSRCGTSLRVVTTHSATLPLHSRRFTAKVAPAIAKQLSQEYNWRGLTFQPTNDSFPQIEVFNAGEFVGCY